MGAAGSAAASARWRGGQHSDVGACAGLHVPHADSLAHGQLPHEQRCSLAEAALDGRPCCCPRRALTRLTKLLRRGAEADGGAAAPPPLGVGALVGIVQPLLLAMIVEGKAGEEAGGHEQKQADKDRGANVTDAAVTALGAVAGALPWVQYQQLLGQHLRLMKRHAGATAPPEASSFPAAPLATVSRAPVRAPLQPCGAASSCVHLQAQPCGPRGAHRAFCSNKPALLLLQMTTRPRQSYAPSA